MLNAFNNIVKVNEMLRKGIHNFLFKERKT